MPSIKRYFPMSHDINSDPEMWEFRELVGQRADAIWEEHLSVQNRNEGHIPVPYFGAWLDYLAHKCRSSRRQVRVALEWLRTPRGVGPDKPRAWVEVNSEGYATVVNYKKYQRTRVPSERPKGALVSGPPNPTQPNTNKSPSAEVDLFVEHGAVLGEPEQAGESPKPAPQKTQVIPEESLDDFLKLGSLEEQNAVMQAARNTTRRLKGKPMLHPFPDPFIPSQRLLDWCVDHQTRFDAHFEEFKDHHISKGSMMADWEAAFRTWVRNSTKFGRSLRAVGRTDRAEQMSERMRMFAENMGPEKKKEG